MPSSSLSETGKKLSIMIPIVGQSTSAENWGNGNPLQKNYWNSLKKEDLFLKILKMNDETYLPIFFYQTNYIDEKKQFNRICINKLFK